MQPGRPWASWLAALGSFCALSVWFWHHLVAAGLGRALASGSGDPGQEVWFLGWTEHALAHGLNPFFSDAIFAPQGVNLAANTALLLPGVVLAPITAVWSPLVTFNVAVIAAPVLSAAGAFYAIGRFVRFRPAAFVGALFYGFGPFLTTDLRYGHLNLTLLVVPPLLVVVLRDVLVTQNRGWALSGTALGALVIAQFFISTEMLAITAIVAVIAVVLLAVTHGTAARNRAAHASRALALGAAISVAALAYPAWYEIAGPRHYVGAVWPDVGRIAATLQSIVVPHGQIAEVSFVSGGNGAYLGAGTLMVLGAGIVVAWRRRRSPASPYLYFFLAMAGICWILSLGYRLQVASSSSTIGLPAWVLGHIPLLESIMPYRFGAYVDLFVALSIALVIEVAAGGPAAEHHTEGRRRVARRRWLAALTVGAACVVPVFVAAPWPYAVEQFTTPAAMRLPPFSDIAVGTIVREYPEPGGLDTQAMVFQAEQDMRYRLRDGYAIAPGPNGHGSLAPSSDALSLVMAAAALGRLHGAPTTTTVQAVRDDFLTEHIGAVVVLVGAKGSARVAQVVQDAIGPPTARPGGAWVWTGVSPLTNPAAGAPRR